MLFRSVHQPLESLVERRQPRAPEKTLHQGARPALAEHSLLLRRRQVLQAAREHTGATIVEAAAIAGEDPNWGRIVMAVGKSGAHLDQKKLTVAIGGVTIAKSGGRVAGYDEREVAAHLRGSDIAINVELGVGRARSRVWTCDLTHDYININADYRT